MFLSLVLAVGSLLCATLAAACFAVEGTLDSLAGDTSQTFNESGMFYGNIYGYLSSMEKCIYSIERSAQKSQLVQHKEKITQDVLNSFLLKKAEIIREELFWAYRHMDYDIVNSEGETLKDIVNSNQGIEFLKYENMVRQEAFEEQVFHISYSLPDTSIDFTLEYTWDDKEAIISLEEQFDLAIETNYYDYIIEIEDELKKVRNVRCYFSYNGEVSTNMENAEEELASIRDRDIFVCFEDGKYEHSGMDSFETDVDARRYVLYSFMSLERYADSLPEGASVYLYVEDTLEAGDSYAKANDGFYMLSGISVQMAIVLAVLLFLLAMVFVFFACCLSGHKSGVEGIVLNSIDKVPTDIHFILSWALCLGFATLMLLFVEVFGFSGVDPYAFTDVPWYSRFAYSPLAFFGTLLCGAISWLFFYEWVCSVARMVKSEKSYFRSSIIGWLVVAVLKLLKTVFVNPFVLLKKAIAYQPGQFKKKSIIIFGIAFCAYLLIVEMGIYNRNPLFTVLFVLVCNLAAAWFLIKYIAELDEIITASAERREPNVDVAKLPKSLRVLANSMSVTTHELNRAVEAAVRDERMRTELITNVSHDLKTPLTSIISYVDLLKRCDISDETALSYISVLEDKSARLKRLIEDLVEASKASSGAVKLNIVRLNFAELINQALGENSESFRDADVDVVFTPEQAETTIFADGQKTYRIIENLLDNACKYSAPHTRVYMRLFRQDDMCVFEIKNISRAPLNITPEELTQRFVRGDSSRTDGGNGLGLAIASDLCALHKGELKLFIDGDLFKAQVWLPTNNIHVE